MSSHQAIHASFVRGGHKILRCILLSIVCCTLTSAFGGEGGDVPPGDKRLLVAPVKVLAAPAPTPANDMAPAMAVQEEAKPTTPGGKLPQYQLGHLNRSVPEESAVQNPHLRLFLALPEHPVLIEAEITIDGKPYLQPREDRVQDLLQFAADPEKYRKSKITFKQQTATLLANLKEAALKKLQEKAAEVETAKAEAAQSEKESDEAVEGPAAENESDNEEPKSESADSEAADSEETETVEDVPEVAEYIEPASVFERIERYMAATEERLTAPELRWLLTDWIDGPTVLLLNDNYQRFRADQMPVFDILDRDRDRTISEKELKLAVSSFEECDLNRDDLVQYGELAEVAMDPREQATHAGDGKLTFLLPTATTAVGIYERLAHRYDAAAGDDVLLPRFDADKNGRFDPNELEDLRTREADVKISITFNTRKPDRSQIAIVSVAPELIDENVPAKTNPNSVTLKLAGQLVDFGAVQSGYSDQISVGAVDDGYPMLPVVDPNDDGRFTRRELRSLNEKLAGFDVNKDGSLTPDEVRSTIRCCFGLGPLVHAELASIRKLSTPDAAPTKTGPDWFVRMDKNKDGDLVRREFLGTDQHFADADTDSDKLISPEEAEAFKAE